MRSDRTVKGWVFSALIVALAAAGTIWPDSAQRVERSFSLGVYPRVQRFVTGASNLCPFSWLDAMVVTAFAALAWALWSVVRAPGGSRWRRAWRAAAGGVVLTAVCYLLFLSLWGLNYRKVPLGARLDFERARVSEQAVAAFAERAADAVNRARPASTAGANGDVVEVSHGLEGPFKDVCSTLGLPDVRLARPKVPLTTVFFNATGVSGMTNPFGLETLIASNLLPFERPMVVAHEWAHLAGIGPESEATFVGLLVCLRADRAANYSAWLDLTLRVLRALPDDARRRLVARLSPQVVADIRAMGARNDRDRVQFLSLASWKVYDRYLKANRVTEGVRSYDEALSLVLGTRFGPEWEPVMR